MIFDFIIEINGTDNIFLIFYVINLIFAAIAYKLGFARKLSFGKNVFVYLMLMVGTYIITIFSVFKMPITESLVIIVVVLAIYRFRLHNQRKAQKRS